MLVISLLIAQIYKNYGDIAIDIVNHSYLRMCSHSPNKYLSENLVFSAGYFKGKVTVP